MLRMHITNLEAPCIEHFHEIEEQHLAVIQLEKARFEYQHFCLSDGPLASAQHGIFEALHIDLHEHIGLQIQLLSDVIQSLDAHFT